MALSWLFCFSLVKVASLFAGGTLSLRALAKQSILIEPMTVCFNVIPLAEEIASSSTLWTPRNDSWGGPLVIASEAQAERGNLLCLKSMTACFSCYSTCREDCFVVHVVDSSQ